MIAMRGSNTVLFHLNPAAYRSPSFDPTDAAICAAFSGPVARTNAEDYEAYFDE